LSGTGADKHLVLVTGLSGGGKSTALRALEDLGYNCVDNLPAALLREFAAHVSHGPAAYSRVALGIDARSPEQDLENIPVWLDSLSGSGIQCQMLFLEADSKAIIKRFSETRRRHPLTGDERALPQAIGKESALLHGLRDRADWVIDTSDINIHQLRRQVWKCIGADNEAMTIVLESFAFKRGVPQDVDFIFDARILPNPRVQRSGRAGAPVAGEGRVRRAPDRRRAGVPEDLAAGVPRQPAQLRHRRHRLHRRPAPLGVPGRPPRGRPGRGIRRRPHSPPGTAGVSVGIVIVTHGDTGAALLEVAEFILGESMAEIAFVPFRQSGDELTTIVEVRAAVARADSGDGVLVLTDLIGASPSNRVADVLEAHSGVMVTGLNLAMLMSVWNYRREPLGLLARKAVESGRRGVKILQE
jgi:UPF0042 nucleotide-binding protein